MTTRANCPACDSTLQLPDAPPGSRFRCARCKVVLVTTEEGGLATESSSVTASPSPPRWEDVGRRRDEEDPRDRLRWEDEDDEEPRYRPRFRRPGRAEALAKVGAPGTILQIYGVLWALLGLALPAIALAVDEEERAVVLAFCLAGAVLCVAYGVFTIIGGTRMKALRSYGLALATVVVSFVMGFLFCPLLMLVGIWPLIVLLDGGVKANFDTPEASPERW